MSKKEVLVDVLAMAGLAGMGMLGASYVQTTQIASIGLPVLHTAVTVGVIGVPVLSLLKKTK